MGTADRPYDLVVWGATGFAGRLVAEYLTRQYGPDAVSLALGGRSRDRLDALERDLSAPGRGRLTAGWRNHDTRVGHRRAAGRASP
jgi:uncharacterized protein YbjT (DUF2867 family)